MANPNPKLLPPLQPVSKTGTFTDPARPGLEWNFTFAVFPEYGFDLAYIGISKAFTEEYVTGKNSGPPAPTIPIGGRQPFISEKLNDCIAYLIQCNVTEPDVEVEINGEKKLVRWGFDEWFAFSVQAPNAFGDALLFAQALQEEARDPAKNSP